MAEQSSYFCSKCSSEKAYNDEYDAYYCELCNVWLEPKCKDAECRFCTTRPDKPSQATS